jgi:hypothetical protein
VAKLANDGEDQQGDAPTYSHEHHLLHNTSHQPTERESITLFTPALSFSALIVLSFTLFTVTFTVK